MTNDNDNAVRRMAAWRNDSMAVPDAWAKIDTRNGIAE
jgi:hypothetical protein